MDIAAFRRKYPAKFRKYSQGPPKFLPLNRMRVLVPMIFPSCPETVPFPVMPEPPIKAAERPAYKRAGIFPTA